MGFDETMADIPIPLVLGRLGRLGLAPPLRGFQPGSTETGLAVTAIRGAPASGAEPQYAWDVAWADASRQAAALGADDATAKALSAGAGKPAAGGSRLVASAHGQVLLSWWLPPGSGPDSVRIGPLPYLLEVADAAARQPARVIVLADRHGAAIVAHPAGGQDPPRAFPVPARPGTQPDPHPGRPASLHHGERHLTDSEPESGGGRNDRFIAARVTEAASGVGAHVILGAGDPHVLGAIAEHLPDSLGPVTIVAAGPFARDNDDQPVAEAELSAGLENALRDITATAADDIADLVAASATAADPGAVRGLEAVARQLTNGQVAVLLVAADAADDDAGYYRIGDRPTEFLVGADASAGGGAPVTLESGLAWAALHQDAVVLRLPDRGGVLEGHPVAALLRHGLPRHRA
jgi:Bacterial archaeo-eukaryotic release factor family 2